MTSFNFTPPQDLLPSEWAEQNIFIPTGNARPGRISFDEMVYQRQIMDVAEDPTIHRMTLMMGAQTGKTMAALALMGYYTLHKPQSQILMQPTENDVKVFIETKYDPLVYANRALRKLLRASAGTGGCEQYEHEEVSGRLVDVRMVPVTEHATRTVCTVHRL